MSDEPIVSVDGKTFGVSADGVDLKVLEEMFGHGHDADLLEGAAHAVLEARQHADECEQQWIVAKAYLAQVEEILLVEMTRSKAKSVTVAGARLTATTTTHYAPPSDALEDGDFFRWLLRSGGGDLVRRFVHRASFGKFCRDLLAAEKPVHLKVKQVVQTIVSVTRLPQKAAPSEKPLICKCRSEGPQGPIWCRVCGHDAACCTCVD